MTTVLITGANRGIGLELARRCAARGDEVLTTCRKRSPELDGLGVRVFEGVDVTDSKTVAGLAKELGDARIDVLVNNAGVMRPDDLSSWKEDDLRLQLETNALGPLRVTAALADRLGRGAKVAIVSSLMGSIGDNGSGGYYGYRMSKAAANAVGVSLARDLEDRGVAVVLLHPGMVATEMTGRRGIAVEESAAGLLARIDELDLGTTGRFVHQDGRELPW